MYPFAHVKVVGNKKIMKLTEAGLGNEKKTEDVEEFDTSEEKFLLDNVKADGELEAEIHCLLFLRGKNGESVRNRGQFWEKCTQSWFYSLLTIH